MSPVGIGTEATWAAVREGRSGIAHIQSFDVSAFSCQIAGEVKGFDPAAYIEKKEIKKMGRFIQFAIAATECALSTSGFKVREGEEERTGVCIGSGIGGFDVIEREHKTYLDHGPRRISPFFIPATIINLASGIRLDSHRSQGSEFGAGHGLHHRGARHRRFVPPDPARLRRCDDLRRSRSLHHAHGSRRIRRHAGAYHAERRAGARLAVPGTRIATDSSSAKARAF